jgi:phospholipase/carboxylesterase
MNQDVNANNWLCTHGTEDNVLPYEISREQIQTLQDGGFNIEFKSYKKDHSIDRDEIEMIAKWIKNKF